MPKVVKVGSDMCAQARVRARAGARVRTQGAALAVKPIPGLLDRILADDYVAVSSKGDVRGKAEQIRLDAPDPAFKSSKLDYVHYRHFGDTVIAQGGESLQRKDRGPDHRLI